MTVNLRNSSGNLATLIRPSSHLVDESQDENPPTIGGSELASPMVASKTVPMDPRRSEAEEAVPPASSFDSGHLFGSRAGSSDLAFEKRRLCPA